MALWYPDGHVERVPEGAFVKATRAALRATDAPPTLEEILY